MRPHGTLEIDFEAAVKQKEFTVHRIENNTDSQQHLEENLEYFKGQCTTVFNMLMRGNRMSVDGAYNLAPKIRSLPRRIMDITEEGFIISREWKGNCIEYFMSDDNINYNLQLLKKIKNS